MEALKKLGASNSSMDGTDVATKKNKWPKIQQVVLFFFGLGGFTYETLAVDTDRIWLLAALGGMVGLPWVNHVEGLIKKRMNGETQEKESST